MSAYRPSSAVTLRAIAVCAIIVDVPIVSTCFNEKFTCRSVFEEHIRNVDRITDRNSAFTARIAAFIDHLQTCAVFNKEHSIDLRIRISIHGNRITVEIQRDRFTLDQSQNVLTILCNDIFLGKRNVAHKNECFAIPRIVNCRLERGIIFTRAVILNAFFHTFVFAVFVEYDHIIIVVRNRHRVCYNCACVKRLAVLTNFSGYSHFSALVKNDLSALFDIKGSVHGYFGAFANRKCRAVRNRQLLSVQIKACAVKRHLSRSRISHKYSIGKKRNCLVFICSGRSIGKRIVHDRSVCIVNLRLRLCQIYYGVGVSSFINTRCVYIDFVKLGIFYSSVDCIRLTHSIINHLRRRSYVNGRGCVHLKLHTRSLYHKSNAEVIGTHILFGRNECIRDSHIACGANICTVKRIRNRRILDREFRTIAIIHDTVNNGKIATVNRDFGSDSTRNVNTRNVGSQFRSAVGMFNKFQIAAGKRYFCALSNHVNATLLITGVSAGVLFNGKIFDFYAAVNVNVDGASFLGGKRFAVTVKRDFFFNRDRRSCITLCIRTEGNILEQCHRIARLCSVNGALQGGISHVADFGNVIRRNFCCCSKGQKHSNHPCKKHSKNHFCVILFHKNLSFNKFFHIKLHRSMWQYLCTLII